MTKLDRGQGDSQRSHAPGTLAGSRFDLHLRPGYAGGIGKRNFLHDTPSMATPIPQEERAGSIWPLPFPEVPERAPARSEGRSSFGIRYPLLPTRLAHECLGSPGSGRQLCGNHAV
jgi:hypothetical protein